MRKIDNERSEMNGCANIKEDDIIESIYESNKSWVSVEVKIDRELAPDELFNLTESQAGDRFYFRLNDNASSFFGYHAVQRFKNNFDNKQSIFREWEKFKKILNWYTRI